MRPANTRTGGNRNDPVIGYFAEAPLTVRFAATSPP
jgi:hypothetical protein